MTFSYRFVFAPQLTLCCDYSILYVSEFFSVVEKLFCSSKNIVKAAILIFNKWDLPLPRDESGQRIATASLFSVKCRRRRLKSRFLVHASYRTETGKIRSLFYSTSLFEYFYSHGWHKNVSRIWGFFTHWHQTLKWRFFPFRPFISWAVQWAA